MAEESRHTSLPISEEKTTWPPNSWPKWKAGKDDGRRTLVTWGYGIVAWLSFLPPSVCLLKGNPICVHQFLPLLNTHTHTHTHTLAQTEHQGLTTVQKFSTLSANPKGHEQASQRLSMDQHTLVSEVKLLDQKDAGTLGKGEVWGLRPQMGSPDGKLFRKGAQS